jgi:hypothetical protein
MEPQMNKMQTLKIVNVKEGITTVKSSEKKLNVAVKCNLSCLVCGHNCSNSVGSFSFQPLLNSTVEAAFCLYEGYTVIYLIMLYNYSALQQVCRYLTTLHTAPHSSLPCRNRHPALLEDSEYNIRCGGGGG